MAAPLEVLLTSEASGQVANISCWDPATGTVLTTFRSGVSGPRSLCVLGNDYVMSSFRGKPLLHAWSLHKKENIHCRMVCMGQVTALTTSPDQHYCIGAVSDHIHVWQITTGYLRAVLKSHYQKVNCLKFTDDGSHFISGGDDCTVIIWSMSKILGSGRLTFERSEEEPTQTWTGHSLPITDIHVGKGGVAARVYTSSRDRTVRIWELASGSLLCTLYFESGVSALAVDGAETRLLAGTLSGAIFQVDLFKKPVRVEQHIEPSLEERHLCTFTGHSKPVTCMSVSLDGSQLVSGSDDSSVKLWDIASKQCLKTLPHKDAVTNVLFLATPPNMLNPVGKPAYQMRPFKRRVHDGQSDTEERETIDVCLRNRKRLKPVFASVTHVSDLQSQKNQDDSIDEREALLNELKSLKSTNHKLYKYSLQSIVNKTGSK